MLRTLLLMALACAAPSFAQTEGAPSPQLASAGRQIVEAANRSFESAFEARDAQAIAALYTEDGRVIPPGQLPVSGRKAIATFWEETMQRTQRIQLETQEAELDGELILEEGVARLTGADGMSEIQYLVVWKRVGGGWYLHRDIWNDAGLAADIVGGEAPVAQPPLGADPYEALEVPTAPDDAEATGLLEGDDVP
jgi:uncharacterized protein (TIGR02246 family)